MQCKGRLDRLKADEPGHGVTGGKR
jgi:hypothetical protein